MMKQTKSEISNCPNIAESSFRIFPVWSLKFVSNFGFRASSLSLTGGLSGFGARNIRILWRKNDTACKKVKYANGRRITGEEFRGARRRVCFRHPRRKDRQSLRHVVGLENQDRRLPA